jgi:perosamine synthetase
MNLLKRLAIDGGTPVRRTFLPYGRQKILPEDVREVTRVLRSSWITTGPKISEFENVVAKSVGARHAVAFSSGTAALHGAVFAAGLGPGDEAITSPLTFCATANCLLYQGATPVFADVEPDTLTLDPKAVNQVVTRRTKAILPVDYAGHPADLDVLLRLAKRHGLVVIEDACHALGARYHQRPVGGISHMTVFSFHPVKHITTGEGGLVATNDSHLAGRLRRFRSHGINIDAHARRQKGDWIYDMMDLGYNYRLTDMACALGISQMRRLTNNLKRRREIADHYAYDLSGMPGLSLPSVRQDVDPAWHLYPIRLDLDRIRGGRKAVFRALWAEGIGVNVHYIPVYFHSYYRKRFGDRRGLCPVAEEAYERLISLPMSHAMTLYDARDVSRAVRKVMAAYVR